MFEGGFRDLDKLACMYFNYRILFYEERKSILDDIERKIVESIKDEPTHARFTVEIEYPEVWCGTERRN